MRAIQTIELILSHKPFLNELGFVLNNNDEFSNIIDVIFNFIPKYNVVTHELVRHTFFFLFHRKLGLIIPKLINGPCDNDYLV